MDIINIIEKKIYTDGEPYYFNTETTEKYGEIVGGLAWPETTKGFLVIVAVDFLRILSWRLATLGSLKKRLNLISAPF